MRDRLKRILFHQIKNRTPDSSFFENAEILKKTADREAGVNQTEELKLEAELNWLSLGGEAAPEGLGAA